MAYQARSLPRTHSSTSRVLVHPLSGDELENFTGGPPRARANKAHRCSIECNVPRQPAGSYSIRTLRLQEYLGIAAESAEDSALPVAARGRKGACVQRTRARSSGGA